MPGLILLAVLALSMAACGSKTADEAQIIEELESNQEFSFLADGEQVDKIIIEKMQTDKDQKTDTVWCTVITSDTEISYQKSVVLTYGLYDKEGWKFDEVLFNSDFTAEMKAEYFLKTLGNPEVEFGGVMENIQCFLEPVWNAILNDNDFFKSWNPAVFQWEDNLE